MSSLSLSRALYLSAAAFACLKSVSFFPHEMLFCPFPLLLPPRAKKKWEIGGRFPTAPSSYGRRGREEKGREGRRNSLFAQALSGWRRASSSSKLERKKRDLLKIIRGRGKVFFRKSSPLHSAE